MTVTSAPTIGEETLAAFTKQEALVNRDHREQLVQASRMLSDMLKPNPFIYWADFLGSWLIGAFAVAVAVFTEPFSWSMVAAFLIAVFAWFRVSIFIHEITHLPSGSLAGFRAAWNVLAGIPLLLPSIMYEGVHASHHRPTTYGTRQDPEYHPVNGRPLWILLTILISSIIPVVLAIRFLVLAPLGFLIPRYHRHLERTGSAYVINPLYRRTMNQEERRRLYRGELLVLSAWIVAFLLAWQGQLPWRAFPIWGAVYMSLTFINHLRMLGAHRFASNWEQTDRTSQFIDSIDTPNGPLMELLMPVGLRYHALHHLMPSLPYHNLGRAYRRLLRELPDDAIYRAATSKSVLHSWVRLWRGSSAPRESIASLDENRRCPKFILRAVNIDAKKNGA